MKMTFDYFDHDLHKQISPVCVGQIVDVYYVVTKSVWEFPKHRFFEYETKDEPWCRQLGIGKEIVQERTVVIPNARIVVSVLG